jgi:hypothetical protein
MAYQSKNLSCIGYANGFSLWHYRTEDHRTEVFGAGYFNEASRMVRAGDFLLLNAQVADKEPSSGTLVIKSVTAGEVILTKAGF